MNFHPRHVTICNSFFVLSCLICVGTSTMHPNFHSSKNPCLRCCGASVMAVGVEPPQDYCCLTIWDAVWLLKTVAWFLWFSFCSEFEEPVQVSGETFCSACSHLQRILESKFALLYCSYIWRPWSLMLTFSDPAD